MHKMVSDKQVKISALQQELKLLKEKQKPLENAKEELDALDERGLSDWDNFKDAMDYVNANRAHRSKVYDIAGNLDELMAELEEYFAENASVEQMGEFTSSMYATYFDIDSNEYVPLIMNAMVKNKDKILSDIKYWDSFLNPKAESDTEDAPEPVAEVGGKLNIKLITRERDYGTTHELIVNGETKEYIGNSEPEDLIMGRDLICGDQIIEYIEMGYKAAKQGKELDISHEDATGETE